MVEKEAHKSDDIQLAQNLNGNRVRTDLQSPKLQINFSNFEVATDLNC